MKSIIVTGGAGLIGKKLVKVLSEMGYSITVFSRSPDKARRSLPFAQDFVKWSGELNVSAECIEKINGAYAVIHLAGEPVAKRWSDQQKKEIFESRKNGTAGIVKAISQVAEPPAFFFSASAIGFYGSDGGDAIFTEFSEAGTGFLSNVCIEWEKQALQANEFTRVVIGRIGIVLDPREGALAKMLLPFSMFMGGKIGSGNQWMSWIHPIDIIGFILHAMSNEHVRGTFNLVAPGAVTMNRFTELLSSILHRPSWLHVPDIALSILLGEGAVIATGGQHVLPQRTIESGYRFQYTDCDHTLRDLLG
ncbi:MAG: TIGR01777 family oxidoreductase [Bacteroidota bacterium]